MRAHAEALGQVDVDGQEGAERDAPEGRVQPHAVLFRPPRRLRALLHAIPGRLRRRVLVVLGRFGGARAPGRAAMTLLQGEKLPALTRSHPARVTRHLAPVHDCFFF